LDEEDVESMSDGAGMTNEQYGKARQQAKKASGVSIYSSVPIGIKLSWNQILPVM
jgi:hypothetical protein